MKAEDLVERIHTVHDKYKGKIDEEPEDDASRQESERTHEQMHNEYIALATEFLAQHGVQINEGQMVEVFPHYLIDEERRKIVSLVIADRRSNGTNLADYYRDSTWFEVDPTKPAMAVTYLPEQWRCNPKKSRVVVKMPSILYRS